MTIKTEDEARKCWCPFARTAGNTEPAANRDGTGDNPIFARCIASQCMAWRFHKRYETLGYCGLAGDPS